LRNYQEYEIEEIYGEKYRVYQWGIGILSYEKIGDKL